MRRPPLSLQARALAWLAQREQSRSELRRKLLRLARQQLESAQSGDTTGAPMQDPADLVEPLLDLLQAKGLLSDERFVESRVRVRAPGLGARRIEMELAQHGLKLGAQPLQQLRSSELQRAQQLWQRKFGVAAVDAKARARQLRFLAARGFSGDVIRRVVPAAAGPPADEST
ncbi:MAG: RecX family transcriptional regulator [Rubrivivax sp.]